jgi:ribosomal-protein-alanine N-acetyltransferase
MSPSLPERTWLRSPEEAAMLIRPMKAEDLDQVRAIDRLSFSLPWPESAFQYELNANKAALLRVAEVEAAAGARIVVGMIVVWLIADEAHIATIAVHPDYRGKGIGSSLLFTALQAAIRRGATQAMLEVRAGNETAQALYRRFGFEVSYRRPRYYRDNFEDALLMNLTGMDDQYLEWLKNGAAGQWRNTREI